MHKLKMMCRSLIYHVSVILASLLSSLNASGAPEITSYSRVSRNGASISLGNEARSFQTSPVYIPSKKLRSGEIIDYPSTQKYSTLDEEMLAKLDARTQQAQDRFHPPASFEHVLAHSNALRLQQDASSMSSQSPGSSSSMSSGSYATLPRQVYNNYEPSKDNLPSMTIDDYTPGTYDSYSKAPDPYQNSPKLPSYLEKFPSKPAEYSEAFDDSYLHDHDHGYSHELIYDHPPEHHHHDYTTTEEPEMNDQRLSKKPYSYYYIGKKLWYLPLYFSIYFVIYIAALVLKSIARHKINFPANLAEAAGARQLDDHDGPGWWDLTHRVLEGIEKFTNDNSKSSRDLKS